MLKNPNFPWLTLLPDLLAGGEGTHGPIRNNPTPFSVFRLGLTSTGLGGLTH